MSAKSIHVGKLWCNYKILMKSKRFHFPLSLTQGLFIFLVLLNLIFVYIFVSCLLYFFKILDLSLMSGLSKLKPLLNTKMLWEWLLPYLVCYHKISKSTKKNGKLFQVCKISTYLYTYVCTGLISWFFRENNFTKKSCI